MVDLCLLFEIKARARCNGYAYNYLNQAHSIHELGDGFLKLGQCATVEEAVKNLMHYN